VIGIEGGGGEEMVQSVTAERMSLRFWKINSTRRQNHSCWL